MDDEVDGFSLAEEGSNNDGVVAKEFSLAVMSVNQEVATLLFSERFNALGCGLSLFRTIPEQHEGRQKDSRGAGYLQDLECHWTICNPTLAWMKSAT